MSTTAITKDVMSEYYQRVFPTATIVRWLQYGETGAYLGRREFCFTLIGDIFTRFRSYVTAAALKADLVQRGPEKIDIGAVYNITPDKKLTQQLVPMQRELVFDIDMNDYDAIRSCCTGKRVCASCWCWMATAAHVLRDILVADFGFQHILPVFSGRRGLHMWVLDPAARVLSDEERGGIVGYSTVLEDKGGVNLLNDLRFGRLHPTMRRVHDQVIQPRFEKLFLQSSLVDREGNESPNANSIFDNPAAAKKIYDLLVTMEGHVTRDATKRKLGTTILVEEGEVFSRDLWDRVLRTVSRAAHEAVHFAAMYPRLDEKVSTRRDHLLKLPFCVHPGTGRLCVPLEWDQLDAFDPQIDPPTLGDLLDRYGAIPTQWLDPLTRILDRLEEERSLDGIPKKEEGVVKREPQEDDEPGSIPMKAEITAAEGG